MAQQPPLDPPDAAPGTTPAAAADAVASVAAAAPTTPPRAASASPATAEAAAPEADWAGQLVGTIDQYVGLVRDRTTRPALVATRGLVFGIIILILAVAAGVLLWIAWITGITALVGKVWITYLITGGILVLLGVFLMAKRGPAGTQA